MKVLITGNLGYIGSVMVEHFIERGFDVSGLDNGFYDGYCLVPRKIEATRIPQIRKDMRDIELDDVRGFDAILHLAGLSNDPVGDLNPKLTYDINYHASIRLAELAKRAGVRKFIFSSSCSLYGKGDDSLRTEESQMAPLTAYAESKVLTEKGLAALADKDFCPVLLRNATVMGASPKMRFDLVVNSLCGFAYTAGVVKVLSDGMPWRPNVDVRDVCQAFELAALADEEKARAQAFNVGKTENNMRVKEIAQMVGETFGKEVQILGTTSNDPRSYRVDFGKISGTLGFRPAWTIKDTIKDLYGIFDSIKLNKHQFESEYFTTLKRLKALMEQKKVGEDLRWKETSAR